MTITSIILLLQVALSTLTAHPHSLRAIDEAERAINVAQTYIASITPPKYIWHCADTGVCVQVYEGIPVYDPTGINDRLEKLYPINPVSPCGTRPCEKK